MKTARTDRTVNLDQFKKWTKKIGLRAATISISDRIECSLTKAEQLAAGRYPRMIPPTEQTALATLMGVTRDELFPPVESVGETAS